MLAHKNPEVVKYTPIVTTFLLEGANVAQVIRMVRERTAEGQSLFAWLLVTAALTLWLNFYIICTPAQKWAIRATALGIALNLIVVSTVVYFRYFH